MKEYPTPWQRKMMWAALTACFVVVLVVIVAAVIWTGASIISFLQPILIPVAIAAILAYLLDPLVTKMSRGTLTRTKAIALLFAIGFFALGGLAAWLVPTISVQSENFARQIPSYTERARDYIVDLIYRFDQTFGLLGAGQTQSASKNLTNFLIGPGPSPSPHRQTTASPTGSPQLTAPPAQVIAPTQPKLSSAERQRIQAYVEKQMPKLQEALPTLLGKLWDILKTSIGGFLGATGFLLSLILVPVYLFFLLKEKPRIKERWTDYLPLRASPLKNEVADVILQINSYVVAYFRGQLLVCLVDGILIGTALTAIGLNFAPLIGAMVVVLTMIPYIGIIICWVPAVLIAAFQWGDWTHPIIVTAIFIVIQNLEGLFYAPRIVGNYVGLHPMTVIVSIFVWGLIIGGVIGPLLAVPLTATLKVLFGRYVWGRQSSSGTHSMFQRQLRRGRLTVAIAGLAIAFLIGFFFVSYGSKLYENWREGRLLHQVSTLLQEGKLSKAAQMAQELARRHPDSLAALSVLADTAERQNLEEAVAWRERIARLLPKDPESQLNFASAALRFAKLDLAREALNRVSPRDRDSVAFHVFASWLARAEGNFAEQEEQFAAAVTKEPKNDLYQFNLAALQIRSKDATKSKDARDTLERLITIAPYRTGALRALLNDAVERNDRTAADSFAQQLQMSPEVTFGDYLLCLNFYRKLDEKKFRQLLEKVKPFSARNASDLALLIEWMNQKGLAGDVVKWVDKSPPARLSSPPAVAVADVYATVKNWSRLKR